MSFRVLLVEDEPAARRYICGLIEKFTPELEVVATAGNGVEGFVRTQEELFHLIITDVRMPRADGIEFVTRLRNVGDDTPILIISGYDEFEYARNALKNGVLDYLLKPVSSRVFGETVGRILPILEKRNQAARLASLESMLWGRTKPPSQPSRQAERYRVAVLRIGGLRSRLAPPSGAAPARRINGTWELPGRDGRERVILAEESELDQAEFLRLLREKLDCEEGKYATIATSKMPVMPEVLSRSFLELLSRIDEGMIPGRCRILDAPVQDPPAFDWSRARLDAIAYALANREIEPILKVGDALVAHWRDVGTSPLRIANDVRFLLNQLYREQPCASVDPAQFEGEIDSNICGAGSHQELASRFRKLIRRAVPSCDGLRDEKGAMPRFFQGVLDFVQAHYMEDLSLKSTSEAFRLSRSYFSRLFREYTGHSFGEYVTRCRINAACKLLQEDSDMPIKHVAASCGYEDPYYFSRVFKSVTGYSPRRYRYQGSGCDWDESPE